MLTLLPASSILPQQAPHIHGLELDIGLGRDIGPDRNQVIPARDLHAVTGIVKKSDLGITQQTAELVHGLDHVRLGGVLDMDDVEPQIP